MPCGSSGAGCSCQCFVREHCVFCVSMPERMSAKDGSGVFCTCFFTAKGAKNSQRALSRVFWHIAKLRLFSINKVCLYLLHALRMRAYWEKNKQQQKPQRFKQYSQKMLMPYGQAFILGYIILLIWKPYGLLMIFFAPTQQPRGCRRASSCHLQRATEKYCKKLTWF